VSFSARIDELQEENLRFERELKEWKGRAAVESELRWRTEEESYQLKIANQVLQGELQKCAETVNYFKKNTFKYIEAMNRILRLMEQLKTETSNGEESSGELDSVLQLQDHPFDLEFD
jgi:chromosome segregation ATPase